MIECWNFLVVGRHLQPAADNDRRWRPRTPTIGDGIVGMRERATLLGGSLDTGPRPGGGFQVVAYLPIG